MYVLIDPKHKALDGRYHEKMPDGRVILSMGEAKAMGSLHNVDIIATGRELDEIIAEQKKAGIVPPIDTVDPGMSVDPTPGSSTELNPDQPLDQSGAAQGDVTTQQQSADINKQDPNQHQEGGIV